MEAQDYFKRQNMMVSPNAAKLIKALKILVVGAGAGGAESRSCRGWPCRRA